MYRDLAHCRGQQRGFAIEVFKAGALEHAELLEVEHSSRNVRGVPAGEFEHLPGGAHRHFGCAHDGKRQCAFAGAVHGFERGLSEQGDQAVAAPFRR